MTVAGAVLADDFVALHDPVREALGQRAGAGVALEPAVTDQVELAVAVPVALREQQAPFGARQLDGHLEDELVEVGAEAAALVHRQHLVAQLARPLALGAACAFGAQAQAPLAVQLGLPLIDSPAEREQLGTGLRGCALVLLGTSGHVATALLVESGPAPHRGPLVGPGAETGERGGAEDR